MPNPIRLEVGEERDYEIATGEDVIGRLGSFAKSFACSKDGIIYEAIVGHDDACPTIEDDEPLPSCSCDTLYIKIRRVA